MIENRRHFFNERNKFASNKILKIFISLLIDQISTLKISHHVHSLKIARQKQLLYQHY